MNLENRRRLDRMPSMPNYAALYDGEMTEAQIGEHWRYWAEREERSRGNCPGAIPHLPPPNQYLDGYTEIERAVLHLKHRYTAGQIAQKLGISERTVWNIRKAREEKLRGITNVEG